MINPAEQFVSETTAEKLERSFHTRFLTQLGMGMIELTDLIARPEYRSEDWWRNVVLDLTLTGTGAGELSDTTGSTFRRVGRTFDKLKDIDPDRVAAFIQAGQSVITSAYGNHTDKPDRVKVLGQMYQNILTDPNLERGRERAHQQYLDAIVDSHRQNVISPVLESWVDTVKNASYGVSSPTTLRVGSVAISDYEMSAFLNSKAVKTASPEVKEILYEEVVKMTLGSIKDSDNQLENDVMGRAYTNTVTVTADAFGERFIAKFAKKHDELDGNTTPLERIQKLQESATDFDAAFENLTSPATSFGGKVDLSAAVISVINATRKAVGSRGAHMQGVVSNILVEKALALVGKTDSPDAKNLASEMMSQYLLSGQDAIHRLMLSIEKDDKIDEKQAYISKVVAEAIANITDSNYGAGENHDLSSAVKSRFNRFLKVAATLPETTQSKVYKEATSALLTAIKSQSTPRKKEELVSIYKIVANKLSAGHARAEINSMTNLVPLDEDEIADIIQATVNGGSELSREEIRKQIVDNHKDKQDKHINKIMADRWNAYLDTQLDPNLSEGAAKNLHEAFDIEKNAFEEGLKTMDSEFTVAYLKAGVDGYLDRIKKLGVNDDRNLRMVGEVLALMTRSPIAQSLAEREKTGDGARKTKTLEEGVQFHFFREAHKLGLSGKFAQFIEANSEKDPADVQLCVYMLRLSSLSDLQRKSDSEKTGKEDVDYGIDPTAAEFEAYIGSMIAAFESNKSNMLNGKADIALPEIAAMMQIFAPDTFMRLASTADVEKGAKGRRKAKMSNPERQAVADTIKAMDISDEEKANLTYQATGKLVPYAGIAQRFAGSDVGDTLRSAFAMGGKNALERWLRLNKYDGENKTVPGKSSVLASMRKEDPALTQKRAELFGLYVDLKMSRITDEAFQRGGQLTDLAASELLEISMMLENTPGEDSAVKEKVYNNFSDLLIRIITNISKDPNDPDKKPFNDKLVQMAHTVLKTSVAYWPEEKVDDFIVEFSSRADTTGLGTWIENDNWLKAMYSLAVANEQAATPEEKANRLVREKIGAKICEETINLLRGYTTLLGRDRLHWIGEIVLGTETDGLQNVADKEVQYIGGFIQQAIKLVSFIGSEQEDKDGKMVPQKDLLVEAIQKLIKEDLAAFANAKADIPQPVTDYIDTHSKIMAAMKIQFGSYFAGFTDIMRDLLQGKDPIVRVVNGEIVIPDAPQLVDKLDGKAKGILLGIMKDAGLAGEVGENGEVVDSRYATLDQLIGENKSTLMGSGALATATQVTELTKHSADDFPIIEKIISALQQQLSSSDGQNGSNTNGSNLTISTVDPSAGLIASFAAQSEARSAQVQAVEKIVKSLSQDHQFTVENIRAMLGEAGATATVAEIEKVRQLMFNSYTRMLTDQAKKDEIVFAANIKALEQHVEEMGLYTELQGKMAKYYHEAGDKVTESQKKDVLKEIDTWFADRNAIYQQRNEVAKKFADGLPEQVTVLVQAQKELDGIKAVSLKDLGKLNVLLNSPKGDVRQRAAAIVRMLKTHGDVMAGLRVAGSVPTVDELLEGEGFSLTDFLD